MTVTCARFALPFRDVPPPSTIPYHPPIISPLRWWNSFSLFPFNLPPSLSLFSETPAHMHASFSNASLFSLILHTPPFYFFYFSSVFVLFCLFSLPISLWHLVSLWWLCFSWNISVAPSWECLVVNKAEDNWAFAIFTSAHSSARHTLSRSCQSSWWGSFEVRPFSFHPCVEMRLIAVANSVWTFHSVSASQPNAWFTPPGVQDSSDATQSGKCVCVSVWGVLHWAYLTLSPSAPFLSHGLMWLPRYCSLGMEIKFWEEMFCCGCFFPNRNISVIICRGFTCFNAFISQSDSKTFTMVKRVSK